MLTGYRRANEDSNGADHYRASKGRNGLRNEDPGTAGEGATIVRPNEIAPTLAN